MCVITVHIVKLVNEVHVIDLEVSRSFTFAENLNRIHPSLKWVIHFYYDMANIAIALTRKENTLLYKILSIVYLFLVIFAREFSISDPYE